MTFIEEIYANKMWSSLKGCLIADKQYKAQRVDDAKNL